MGWKPGDIHKRSNAHVLLGRELELQIEKVLADMKKTGEIDEFTRHLPYSAEDRNGKDFTVSVGGVKISFDVTVSSRMYKKRKKHPTIPHLYFPRRPSSEIIKQRISGLLTS